MSKPPGQCTLYSGGSVAVGVLAVDELESAASRRDVLTNFLNSILSEVVTLLLSTVEFFSSIFSKMGTVLLLLLLPAVEFFSPILSRAGALMALGVVVLLLPLSAFSIFSGHGSSLGLFFFRLGFRSLLSSFIFTVVALVDVVLAGAGGAAAVEVLAVVVGEAVGTGAVVGPAAVVVVVAVVVAGIVVGAAAVVV